MNSEDIIDHIASDFAGYLNHLFGSKDPADEYTDPIRAVFGETLTQESVLKTYNSKAGIAKLFKKMKAWCKGKDLTEKIVRDMLRRTIINNFGRDAVT